MVAGIYCITNKVNNKKYFGQSIDIERRKKAYFNYENFHNDHLKRAFNKYGKENFEFQIIKCCEKKYLDRFEKLYIRIYDTMNPDKGYNKEAGGNLNKDLSEETRKKMSENNARYWEGKTLPDEIRKKISDKHTGQKHTPETCKKISENMPDRSGENNPKAKYTIWDINNVKYNKKDMFKNNDGNKPRKVFTTKYKGYRLPIGGFIDFTTPELIGDLITEFKK